MSTSNSTPQQGQPTPPRPQYTKDQGELLADVYRQVPAAGFLALDPNSENGKRNLASKPDTVVPGRFHSSTSAHVTVGEIPDYVVAGYGLGIVAGYDEAKDQYLVIVDADNWEDCAAFEAWYWAHDPDSNMPVVSVRTPGTGIKTHSGGAHYYLVVDAKNMPSDLPSAAVGEQCLRKQKSALGKQVRLGWGVKLAKTYACMPSTQRVVDGEWRDYSLNLADDGALHMTHAYPAFVQDLFDYIANPPDSKVDSLGTVAVPVWPSGYAMHDSDITAVFGRLIEGSALASDRNTPAFAEATNSLASVVQYNREAARWNYANPDKEQYSAQDPWGFVLDSDEVARYEMALRVYGPSMMDKIDYDLPGPERLRKQPRKAADSSNATFTSSSFNDDYDEDTIYRLRGQAAGMAANGRLDTIRAWEESGDESASWEELFANLGNYEKVGEASCGCDNYKRDDATSPHSITAHDRETCKHDNAATQAVVWSDFDDERYDLLAMRADGDLARTSSGKLMLSKYDLLTMAMGDAEEAGRWIDDWYHCNNNAALANALSSYPQPTLEQVQDQAAAPAPAVAQEPATAKSTPPPAAPTAVAAAQVPAPTAVVTPPPAGPTTATTQVPDTAAAPTPPTPPTPTAPPTPPTPPTLTVVPTLPDAQPANPAVGSAGSDDDEPTLESYADRLAAHGGLVEVVGNHVNVYGREGGVPEELTLELVSRTADLVDYYKQQTGITPEGPDVTYTVAQAVNTNLITGKGIGKNSPFDPAFIADICNSTPLTRAVASTAIHSGENPVVAIFNVLRMVASRIHPTVTTPDVSHMKNGMAGSTLNLNLMYIGESGAGKTTAMKSGWFWPQRYGFDHNCYADYSAANSGPGVRETKPGEDQAHLNSLLRKPGEDKSLPVPDAGGIVDADQAVNTKLSNSDPLVQPMPYRIAGVPGVLPLKVAVSWDPDRCGEVGSGEVLADALGEYVKVEVPAGGTGTDTGTPLGGGEAKDKSDAGAKDKADTDAAVPRRETTLEWRTRERACFTVTFDEFEAALNKSKSKQSTMIPKLNSAWSGEQLGNLTSTKGDRTINGPYRLVRVSNAQPVLFSAIREAGKTGMLQREIFVAVEYPWGSLDIGVDKYEKNDVVYPCEATITPDNPTGAITSFTMAPAVFMEAYVDKVGKPRLSRGEDVKAFTHRNLNTIRLACVVAAAHGVTHVSMPIWVLARKLIDYSTRSYYYMRDEGKAAQFVHETEAAQWQAGIRAAAESATEDLIAETAADILKAVAQRGANGEPVERRVFMRKFGGSPKQPLVDKALRLLTRPPSGPPALIEVPPTGKQTYPRYLLANQAAAG